MEQDESLRYDVEYSINLPAIAVMLHGGCVTKDCYTKKNAPLCNACEFATKRKMCVCIASPCDSFVTQPTQLYKTLRQLTDNNPVCYLDIMLCYVCAIEYAKTILAVNSKQMPDVSEQIQKRADEYYNAFMALDKERHEFDHDPALQKLRSMEIRIISYMALFGEVSSKKDANKTLLELCLIHMSAKCKRVQEKKHDSFKHVWEENKSWIKQQNIIKGLEKKQEDKMLKQKNKNEDMEILGGGAEEEEEEEDDASWVKT